MTDGNRSGFGNDNLNRGTVAHSADTIGGHDDPNRGALDRAANAVTGGTGGVSAAIGHDDPDRGPLDRAANAITGGTGGVSAAIDNDDPKRGPLDRVANTLSGTDGSVAATGASGQGGRLVASALFDNQAEAERAVSELRSAGVNDNALSVIAQNKGTTTARNGDGEITDEHHQDIARGILGGGALGAGLGVLALAIPGVGPLVAAGAIAASAVPAAVAVGAAAGAVAGTLNETLKEHGVSDEDTAYYNDGLSSGGVLVTVSGDAPIDNSTVRDILRRNGGHSVNSPRIIS